MSDNKDYELDSESPDIFNYLREEIPVEDLKDYASPKRLQSIDFIKGFAIIFIIFAHTSAEWFSSDWAFLHCVLFPILDVLGPALFVFLSALSVIFSVKRKQGILPEVVIRNRVLSRGISIMLIGALFNLLYSLTGEYLMPFPFNVFSPPHWIASNPFPLNLWGWNILFFLGFTQILSYLSLKLDKRTRIFLGLLIIFFGPAVREIIFYSTLEMYYPFQEFDFIIYFLNFIISSPIPQLPLLPWISIIFISTVFGEYLYNSMMKGTKQELIYLSRIFGIWGSIFLICGILLGFRLDNPNILDPGQSTLYTFIDLVLCANDQYIIPEIRIPGIPEFMVRGYASNILYLIGWSLLLIAISLHFLDIKEKRNHFTEMLVFYGKVSLSLFLFVFVFDFLFYDVFPIWFFVIATLGITGLLGFLMYIWMKYFKGVGSPEWIMVEISRITQKTEESIKKTEESIKQKIKPKMENT
ncbi:MAG: conserved membrane protein of unknown function [Promethearchaeota archaeon]|nr:MAG: conserved membrane protein of unknown function [Candidatus Lokiarchaeota archaeon]